jgi:hypothetical protein
LTRQGRVTLSLGPPHRKMARRLPRRLTPPLPVCRLICLRAEPRLGVTLPSESARLIHPAPSCGAAECRQTPSVYPEPVALHCLWLPRAEVTPFESLGPSYRKLARRLPRRLASPPPAEPAMGPAQLPESSDAPRPPWPQPHRPPSSSESIPGPPPPALRAQPPCSGSCPALLGVVQVPLLRQLLPPPRSPSCRSWTHVCTEFSSHFL